MDYRPDIDGLRAIAVLSVIIFHLNPNWLQGGFVGVDVFFVISGYLITTVIARDMSLDQFSLSTFYQRRIARIFPAFFLVVLATLAGSILVFTEMDLASTGAAAAYATLSTINLKLIFKGNYFELSRDAQPLLHYWSLSVEEQFYALYPLTFLLIAKWSDSAKLKLLALVGAVSLGACIIATRTYPVAAFYLLPTRAWELVAGCSLAIFDQATLGRKAPLFRPQMAAVGLLAIGTSFFLLKEGAGFPGYEAVLPVLGTVCVIGAQRGTEGIVWRSLSAPPLVLLGKMSYSLYLWHWPIFSIVDYRLYLASTATRMPLKLGLTVVATVATYYLVEKPARTFLNLPRNRVLAFTALVSAVLFVVAGGAFLRQTNYVSAKKWRVALGGLTINGKGRAGSIALMGDSQASMYGRMLKDLAIAKDWRLKVLSVAAGDPLPPEDGSDGTLWQDTFRILRKERPDVLIIACLWEARLQRDTSRVKTALDLLRPYVGHFVLLTQPPDMPEQATRASMRGGTRPPFFEAHWRKKKRQEMATAVTSLAGGNVTVVDVEQYFLSRRTGEVLVTDERGQQLFQDRGHLSGDGAARLAEPLGTILNRLAFRRVNPVPDSAVR